MNCKLEKQFQNYSNYHSENINNISISKKRNDNVSCDNDEKYIYSISDRFWPLERFKNFNQKNLNNFFSNEYNIYLNRQNSSNNCLINDNKRNFNVKYIHFLNNNSNENSIDFSNHIKNNNSDTNFKIKNAIKSELNGKINKNSLSRSSSEVQKGKYNSNTYKSKDSLRGIREEIYLYLNRNKSFNISNNNNSSYNYRINYNQNYNNSYHSDYNYYSPMNLLKIEHSNQRKYLESNKKYRELLHNHSNNKNDNYKKNKENIPKSYIESYKNKKTYSNNNNLNIKNSYDFSFDYASKTSTNNSNKKININQIYKKVKLNNNYKYKNERLIRKNYSFRSYRENNNSISPNKKSNNNLSNYSSYINNFMNSLNSKNKTKEKNLNNSKQMIKDPTKSLNSFTNGTNNTFEENIINHSKKNINYIESIEEFHINYIIMLQNTKKLINSQENINTTIYSNNSIKEFNVIYTQEEEL